MNVKTGQSVRDERDPMNRVARTQGPPCLDAQSPGRSEDAADDLERIVSSIGLKVFSLRKSMGLSLQQLGERSDVSAAAIHKIEQGGMVPTITTLLKIAGALGRPVSYFVEEDGSRDDMAVLTPAGETRPVYTSHKGITLSSISGPYARFLLAGARATVAPGASSGRKPMQHPGEELVHVTDGMLEFSVAGQAFQVGPGSTLHFRGDQPHTWRNPGAAAAMAVWLALRPQ
ncbi:MAG TPA: cupin domain-containing protein [Streptosporangiaceae bacterium]|nr:cupin domain-containing protein [Streptosporangiaceae bacterium]